MVFRAIYSAKAGAGITAGARMIFARVEKGMTGAAPPEFRAQNGLAEVKCGGEVVAGVLKRGGEF